MAALRDMARSSFVGTVAWKFQILIGISFLTTILFFLQPETCSLKQIPIVERIFFDDFYIANSKFRISENTRSYNIHLSPDCFLSDCTGRANTLAFSHCIEHGDADEWNDLGVRLMEKYVLNAPEKRLLNQAYWFFSNATALAPNCFTAHMNFGLVSLASGEIDQAETLFKKALEMGYTDDTPIVHMYLGLLYEKKNDFKLSVYHHDRARRYHPILKQDYLGISVDLYKEKIYETPQGFALSDVIIDFALFRHFSPKPIAKYALTTPRTQDKFLRDKHIVLNNVLPPFILDAARRCYRTLIEDNHLPLGDVQSKRYYVHNDRCARFLQYNLVDLVRTIVAHNVKPSYTYFGGYLEGAALEPHTDRAQCEFTISLTIEQSDDDVSWPLGVLKTPLFEKDDNFPGRKIPEIKNNNDVAEFLISDNNLLLFMGRHLVHFRVGLLEEGKWARQVFLHYVRDDFKKTLD